MDIYYFKSVDDARNATSRELENILALHRNESILFLSSGGSALNIFDDVDKNIFSQNFIIGVLDERFSTDPSINNYLQLKNKIGELTSVNWIDSVPLENDTPETLANRIEAAWRNWRSANPKGKIIATMGIGVDGHTAGITSNANLLLDLRGLTVKPRRSNSGWVVGYDAGAVSQFSLRVSATFEFLRSEVDFAIVYIAGAQKRPALEKVLADSGALTETPARIFREMKNVKIFTGIL